MPKDLIGRNLIAINDLSKEEILRIIDAAEKLKKKPMPQLLAGYILAVCFFEPSTRTRLSFESAMHRLGGSVIGFADASVTSLKKGESLRDTTRMISGYADIIVMRHPMSGAPAEAAQVSIVPLINAGDGPHEHPTQTLVDLFSIKESQGKLDGLTVVMVGDLKYGRTVHSLAKALVHFENIKLYFVAPNDLQMPPEDMDYLQENNIDFVLSDSMDEALKEADILYMTRIQQERFADKKEYEKYKGVYVLDKNSLQGVKDNLKIMHPLPRIDEISAEVDDTPHAYYFQEAYNGVFVREALLGLLLGKL